MTNRSFADAVTLLLNDQSAYGRVPIRALLVIEGVLEVVLGEVKAEIGRRKKPKLRVVKP